MTSRIEKTIVEIERAVPELANDTVLRAQIETDSGRVTFAYSSIETQVQMTFPAHTTDAIAEFFTALAADDAIAQAQNTQEIS